MSETLPEMCKRVSDTSVRLCSRSNDLIQAAKDLRRVAKEQAVDAKDLILRLRVSRHRASVLK